MCSPSLFCIEFRPLDAAALLRISTALLTIVFGAACNDGAKISAPSPGELPGKEISVQDREYFENHIRPLLAEHCYECHSESGGKQKGGLWLDRKAGWVQGGDSGPALVAGKPDESLLVSAIHRTEDIVDSMPPDYRLSDVDIEALEEWIQRGAPDPRLDAPAEPKSKGIDVAARKAEHWCWQPLSLDGLPPPLPRVGDPSWGRQPPDAFVLAALEAKGLRPALEVSPEAWLRRVCFDLTGLPPTAVELDEFIAAGADENARRSAVDHLLASPAFGENWARHWMDLVRYADSYGHEFDFTIPHAFEYRDYLIRCFNNDVPYDQLLREHLAGDLLSAPRLDPATGCNESILGTGFWFFHEAAHAPTDPRGDQADHIADQIDVFGKTFLALTLGCARCHDHKFDAITTEDYYALSSHLLSANRQLHPIDPHGRISASAVELEALRKKLHAAIRSPAAWSSSTSPGQVLRTLGTDIQNARAPFLGKKPWPDALRQQLPSPSQNPNQWQQPSSTGADDMLVSKPFDITHPFLNFLIGVRHAGAEHPVAIELIIGDRPTAQASIATIIDSDDFSPVQCWDLREHIGKKALLRLRAPGIARTLTRIAAADALVVAPATADDPTGISLFLHRAVQAEAPARVTPSLQHENSQLLATLPPPPPAIDPLRGEAAVAEILGQITGELSDCESVEAFLATLLANPDRITAIRTRLHDYQSAEKEFYQKSKPFYDFSDDELAPHWHNSGSAFHLTGAEPATSLNADQLIAYSSCIDSGLLGPSLQGTLRTPTFEIPTNNIHLRIRAGGVGVRARLVIDDYQLPFNFGLLFEGTYLTSDNLDTGGARMWKSFTVDLHKYVGHRAWIEFIDDGQGQIELDEIRFANRLAPAGQVHPVIAAILETMPADASPLDAASYALDQLWKNAGKHLISGQLQVVDVEFLNWLLSAGWIDDIALGNGAAELRQQAAEINRSLPRSRFAPTMAASSPIAACIHIRGSHDNPGEATAARNLEALGGREGDRLKLATELTAADNPLTSRVIANRLWHHLFGRGIVASVDDFGPMGQEPSHPELLDWLACDLIDHHWSLKHSLRQIVLSSTYRQSTQMHPDLSREFVARTDPENILLHHYPRRRLPAEAIRDNLLATSGDLIRNDTGGPGVPAHLTSFMTNKVIDHNGPLDGDRRRSVYGQVRRNYLSPFLLSFDFPKPLGTIGSRRQSNVPAQALTLLNDPFVHQQAKRWAEHELAESEDVDDLTRLEKMFRKAIGRRPDSTERNSLLDFLQSSKGSRDDRWADLAHALFNLKEFIYLK